MLLVLQFADILVTLCCAPWGAVADGVVAEDREVNRCTISERAVEAVVVIEIGLVMPDGLPVMDIYNIVFKSLFGFCFWFLRTGQ